MPARGFGILAARWPDQKPRLGGTAFGCFGVLAASLKDPAEGQHPIRLSEAAADLHLIRTPPLALHRPIVIGQIKPLPVSRDGPHHGIRVVLTGPGAREHLARLA